jgi:hypothetical protein
MQLIHDKNAVSSCFSHVWGHKPPIYSPFNASSWGERKLLFLPLARNGMLVLPLSLSCTSTWVIRTRGVQGRCKHRRGVLALSIVTAAGHGHGAAWSLRRRRLFAPWPNSSSLACLRTDCYSGTCCMREEGRSACLFSTVTTSVVSGAVWGRGGGGW